MVNGCVGSLRAHRIRACCRSLWSLAIFLGVAGGCTGNFGGPPRRHAVVCLLDCSLSSAANVPRTQDLILGIADRLDESSDRIELLRLTHEVYPMYRLNSPAVGDLKLVLGAYSKRISTDARGTAYGLGLRHLQVRCDQLHRQGYSTTALVFGDGKDEPVRGAVGANWRPAGARAWPLPSANHHRLGLVFLEPRDAGAFQSLLDRFPQQHRLVMSPVEASGRQALNKLEELILS